MAIDLKMPALSPTMEKGTLAKWLVAEGDAVKPGDLLAEIETDKATMEFEAIDEGRIVRLIVPEGTEDVAVGTLIAAIAEAGEGIENVETAEWGKAVVETAKPATTAPISQETIAETKAAFSRTVEPAMQDTSVNASPLARRIAAIREIALGSITGTGPHGKITKADLDVPELVYASAQGAPTAIASAPITIARPPEGVPVQTEKLSSMRKTIARRLTDAKQSVPHFYLTARCNLDTLLKLRNELNAALAPRGIKLSVNDMLVKALALALVEVPDANVQFGGDELHRFSRVDISMAVAIEGGLITPVIHDVGALSLSAIAQASRVLANKARTGKLTPEDYQGGTASISNLGMFGIDEMFPVINPPQALILGVAAGVEQPWKVDGQLALATIMAATGSFDHRAIDGAVAAQFMAAFREFVETPMLIIG